MEGVVLQIVSTGCQFFNSSFESCSRSHLNISHVLNTLEAAVVLILNDSLALPVSSDDFVAVVALIEDGRHLEGEKVNVWLDVCLLHGTLAHVV